MAVLTIINHQINHKKGECIVTSAWVARHYDSDVEVYIINPDGSRKLVRTEKATYFEDMITGNPYE